MPWGHRTPRLFCFQRTVAGIGFGLIDLVGAKSRPGKNEPGITDEKLFAGLGRGESMAIDFQTKAFVTRLIAGRGPVETRSVLEEVVARALRIGSLNRAARREFFYALLQEFRLPRHPAREEVVKNTSP